MSQNGSVLVTGAGGFIGQHLVEALIAQGREVIALDVKLDALEHLRDHPNLRTAATDIRSSESVAELMQGVEIVFHLAAAHLEVSADENYYRSVNVKALQHLLRLASDVGVRRFVHCSTVGVYGSRASIPADENTTCEPDIAYESTKFEGEQAVRMAVHSHGLEAIILRPSWVYGPGCPRTLKLFRSINKRRFFFVGNGQNLRHPVYISDLLASFKLASSAAVPSGETIIIAGPDAVTTRELVEEIKKQLDIHFNPPTLPLTLVTAGCHALQTAYSIIGRDPPFSIRSLKFFTDSSAFSTNKARQLLGYIPKVSLAEGLELTLTHFKRQGLIEA